MEGDKEQSILFKLKNLDKLIFRTLRFNTNYVISEEESGIIPGRSQMEIIHYILTQVEKNEEIYQKDLEQELNLRRATISGILDTMEKNGLINRVVDEKDTRTKKIILSPKAKKIYVEGKIRIKNVEDMVTSGISKEDLNIFYNVMEKMEKNLYGMLK